MQAFSWSGHSSTSHAGQLQPAEMEAKFVFLATLAFVLVQFLVMTTITWHNASCNVSKVESRIERLGAEDKSGSISQFLGRLGVQMSRLIGTPLKLVPPEPIFLQ